MPCARTTTSCARDSVASKRCSINDSINSEIRRPAMKRLTALAMLTLAAALDGASGQTAPRTYFACYVPLTGTVYRIKEGNLKTACTTGHVEFSWTDGADAVRTTDALGGDLNGVFSNANVV